MRRILLSICCISICLVAREARPATFDAVSYGRYEDSRFGLGFYAPSNFLTGERFIGGSIDDVFVSRAFFAFNLSAAPGTRVTGGQFTVFPNGTWGSGFPSHAVWFFDVMTPFDNLINGTGGPDTVTDLGTGKRYGSLLVTGGSRGSQMPQITVNLTSAALDDINALLTSGPRNIAIGALCLTCSAGSEETSILWGSSGGRPRVAQLNLDFDPAFIVPVPAAIWFFGTAIVGYAGIARWRRRNRTIGSASIARTA